MMMKTSRQSSFSPQFVFFCLFSLISEIAVYQVRSYTVLLYCTIYNYRPDLFQQLFHNMSIVISNSHRSICNILLCSNLSTTWLLRRGVRNTAIALIQTLVSTEKVLRSTSTQQIQSLINCNKKEFKNILQLLLTKPTSLRQKKTILEIANISVMFFDCEKIHVHKCIK